MTVPFISVADLEALLGVGVTDTDLIVSIALDSACTAVRSYIDQNVNFVPNDVIYLDGTGKDAFRLPERPVRSVTEVREDGVVVAPGTYPDHNWVLSKGSGVIVRQSGVWRAGRRNIKVTYDHGWDVTGTIEVAVPADLRLVALSAARRIYKAVGNVIVPGIKQSETIGAYSYASAPFPPEVAAAVAASAALLEPEKAILDRYRAGGPKSGSKS